VTLAQSVLVVGFLAVIALWDLGRRVLVHKAVRKEIAGIDTRVTQARAAFELAVIELREQFGRSLNDMRNELRATPARGPVLPFGKRG
jgi:hypothetical protein